MLSILAVGLWTAITAALASGTAHPVWACPLIALAATFVLIAGGAALVKAGRLIREVTHVD